MILTEEVKKKKSPYALGRICLFIRDKHMATVGKTQRNFSGEKEEEDNTQVEMSKKEV